MIALLPNFLLQTSDKQILKALRLWIRDVPDKMISSSLGYSTVLLEMLLRVEPDAIATLFERKLEPYDEPRPFPGNL